MKHSLIYIFLFFSICDAFADYTDHRNRKQDSLELVLQANPPQGEELLRIYDNLLWGFLQIDAEKTKHYARLNNELAIQLDSPKDVQNGLRAIGMCYYGACVYDTAQYYLDQAVEWAQKMKGHRRNYSDSDIDNAFSVLYGTLANLYSVQGKVHLASEYYMKALEIFERYGWNESVALCYYNLGETFLELSNNAQAEHYYRKAIEFADKAGDSLIMAAPRHGLAYTLLNDKRPEEALQYALESLPYYQDHAEMEVGNLLDMQVLLSRIYQLGFKDLARAQEYMNEAYRLIHNFENPTNISDAYAQQASIYLDQNEWQQSVLWADSSLAVNDQDPHHNIGVYKTLAEANARWGKGVEAQRYINLLFETMSELSEKQFQSSLSEMEVLYETNKKEARIREMEQEARLHRLQIIIMSVVLVAFVIVTIIVLFVIRQRRKLAMVKAQLQGEVDERTRLGRDLHDRLGSLLTAIRLSVDGGNSDIAQLSTLAAEAQTEMRRVAHHLMPQSLHHDGLKTALNDFIATLPVVTFHFTGIDRRLDEQQETMLYCTGHELVNNALKHAHARHIDLQLIMSEEFAALIVSDDGVGFDAEHQGKSGMGLDNIRQRTKALNGRFDIVSRETGTEINVEIPL